MQVEESLDCSQNKMAKTAADDEECAADELGLEEEFQRSSLTCDFITFNDPLEKNHPFTVPLLLANIFGHLDVETLHNVRLVSTSKIWQSAAASALLNACHISKPANWPTSGPLRPCNNLRAMYTRALDRLLSKSSLFAPTITLTVMSTTDFDFYQKRSTLLSRVGHLNYGLGEDVHSINLSIILVGLPNIKTINLVSSSCLNCPFNDPEDQEVLQDVLFQNLKRVKKIYLNFPLPPAQLQSLLGPTVKDHFGAITFLEFGTMEWTELEDMLDSFLQVNPPWHHIDTLKLTLCEPPESGTEPTDYSIIRDFLLHLEKTAKLQNLRLTFEMSPGRNDPEEDNCRLSFDPDEPSMFKIKSNYEEDDWLLPFGLTQLTTLQLKFVIPKDEEPPGDEGTLFVPPEFIGTLVAALRLPNLKTLVLQQVNKNQGRSCTWAQTVQLVQEMGQPCLSLRELIVFQEGGMYDCPFFPATLWPNLTNLKFNFNCPAFHGVTFLRSIWPQYIRLEDLWLWFKVTNSMDLISDLSEILWGKKWPESTVNDKKSIVNLKGLKTLDIRSDIPEQYIMTDFSIHNGLVHLKNLQSLLITEHLFSSAAVEYLKTCLGSRVCCKILTTNQDDDT